MRITNNIISNNYLSALNQSLDRQSQIQEQLTDGKAIHRPSDDPIKTIRSLRFNTNASMNDQFTQNVNDAASWMETTDAAMSDLSSIMIRIKELTVSADNTKPADALNAIGAEVDQLINQAVTIGNTKIGDRYVFAGQMDNVQPFERKQIKDTNATTATNGSNKTMDVVVYHGDLNKISMIIKPGSANPNEDSINLTGPDIFGPLEYKFGNPVTGDPGTPTMGIFNQLISLKEELQKKTATIQSAGATGAATIGGTYTGTGYANYDVRIDSIDANHAVTGASYSTDGGNTWKSGVTVTTGTPFIPAVPPVPGPAAPAVPAVPSVATLPLVGVTLSMAVDPGNAVNGTYSFHVPNSTSSTSTSGTDVTWISNVGLGNVDAAHSSQLKIHSELGARMATYEMAKNMMENNKDIIMKDVSLNEDLDYPAAIIDQKTSENIYKAALSVGAKIMPLSLVDFLR